MNIKAKKAKVQLLSKKSVINVLSQDEIKKKVQVIEQELKASTWCELETKGKFEKNDKLSFISDEVLIVGCDIGSETHYIRAIDTRGRELSKGAFEFSNSSEGFASAKAWVLNLAAKNDKKQIVLGLEPTGHYWFAIAAWMVSNRISVVIANLVKDGNYGMPYLPEDIYADMRRLSMFRDQLTETFRNIWTLLERLMELLHWRC